MKKTALITGASEGLGKFLAIELAAKGYDLLLVALPQSGLSCLAEYISHRFGVKAYAVETDLTDKTNCFRLLSIAEALRLEVEVLINNAGMGGNFWFEEKSPEFYSRLISLNVSTPTLLCRLFLPLLKKNACSYILNVSSLAALFHLPRKQVYCGSKSYLYAFSNSLRRELKNQGVRVSLLCPGGMNTYWRVLLENRTSGTWLSRLSVMEPSVVAERAIRGMFAGRKIIIPGKCNLLFLYLGMMIPALLKEKLMEYQVHRTRPRFS